MEKENDGWRRCRPYLFQSRVARVNDESNHLIFFFFLNLCLCFYLILLFVLLFLLLLSLRRCFVTLFLGLYQVFFFWKTRNVIAITRNSIEFLFVVAGIDCHDSAAARPMPSSFTVKFKPTSTVNSTVSLGSMLLTKLDSIHCWLFINVNEIHVHMNDFFFENLGFVNKFILEIWNGSEQRWTKGWVQLSLT